MSGLGSTMSLIENVILSEDQSTSTSHQLIQQLRNQKPGIEFLVESVNKERLPPTPPVDDMDGAQNQHQGLDVSSEIHTGITPSADMKCWVEPPPEYTASSDAPTAIDEKQDVKEAPSADIKEVPRDAEESTSDVQAHLFTNNDEPELHEAVLQNDTETTAYLLSNNADPNAPRGDLQRTPLHQAAHLNHTQCLPILLRHGAIMNSEDSKGDTPLHLAAWAGNVEALSTLLAHGAEVDWLSGRDGYSPLWCAISAYEIDAARLLLRHGARVSLRSMSGGGLMPLHQAAVMGQSAMCELLLERGAQVDCSDETMNTPLHYAAACGSVGSVKVLLQAGADMGKKTVHGLTPLHWAAHKGHAEAVGLLVSCGAEVNARAAEEATPLHLAANRGHLPAVRLLLANGADRWIEAEAWDGASGRAVDMAREKGHDRVVAVLKE
ncbi:hypothetical protein MBLNU230_g6555t1 [Neophaeotheca triangularis]